MATQIFGSVVARPRRGRDLRRDHRLSPALALSAGDQGHGVRAHRVPGREGGDQRRRVRHPGPARGHAGRHARFANRGGAVRQGCAHHLGPHPRRCHRRLLHPGRLDQRNGGGGGPGLRPQDGGGRQSARIGRRPLCQRVARRRRPDDAVRDARTARRILAHGSRIRHRSACTRRVWSSRRSRSSISIRRGSNSSIRQTPSTPKD